MPPKKTSTTPSTKKKSIPWDRDGINDGPSSIQIVLSWISADDNYERWRGDNKKGKTKTRFLSQIVQEMIQHGIMH
ncbi:hypothetical protein Pst134EB_018362 [Puccinia striiformis f. sp. tritici]|nr:hypothetical protein Pst134EB_018362 [Puccinia striiformis f. sp. tritici]